MLRDYLPIVIMLVLSAGFVGVALGLSWILAPRRPDPVKDATYECGVEPVGDARMRHSVRFYVVAMLFIIFDLETVFLYPWAVTYRKLGLFGLIEMVVFLAILMVGYVYVWRRGALDWSEQAEENAARLQEIGAYGSMGGFGPGGGLYEWGTPAGTQRPARAPEAPRPDETPEKIGARG